MRLDSKLVDMLLLTMLIAAPRRVWADFKVLKVGDSLVDARALTIQVGFGQCINGLSFQQDAVVTHGEHHYWRAGDGKWHHRELPPVAGNRPKVLMDKSDNAYIIFGTRRQPAKLADGHLHSAGDLAIAAATAASEWKDWKVVHVEKGPFVNEMLGDNYRWAKDGVLSIMVQQSPEKTHQPTPLRILDFSLEEK